MLFLRCCQVFFWCTCFYVKYCETFLFLISPFSKTVSIHLYTGTSLLVQTYSKEISFWPIYVCKAAIISSISILFMSHATIHVALTLPTFFTRCSIFFVSIPHHHIYICDDVLLFQHSWKYQTSPLPPLYHHQWQRAWQFLSEYFFQKNRV